MNQRLGPQFNIQAFRIKDQALDLIFGMKVQALNLI